MLFSHTNYDTDIVINMLKRIGTSNDAGKTSITTNALRSVSQTNIDLFVDIKMKNIVLQILKIVSRKATNDPSRLSASLTDLFYIIPYYTYKYYDEVDMNKFGGGKRRPKYKSRPK